MKKYLPHRDDPQADRFTAYRPTFAKFAEEDIKFFAAAHMWDVSAATQGEDYDVQIQSETYC